ncbi:MAG: hypothetical protein F6K09_16225 [Merismopedia sp. SIO2A8]|nr:hypothetical protein [Symploca sp. SIO2B6]NET50224.1 hypothetical protein [Merismopedia sp. SIO2A8]
MTLLAFLPNNLSQESAVKVAISSVPLFLSIVCAIFSVLPRVDIKPLGRTVFWGNIQQYSTFAKYHNEFISKNTNKLEQVLEQVYCLAKIAQKKYSMVSWALRFQVIGLVVFWFVVFSIRIY